MKPRVSHQKTAALTLVEVLVVVVVITVLASMLLPYLARPKRMENPINCVNNLKQIGLAYRIWADEYNGKYPMQVSITNGGTMELNNGSNALATFLVMSNELATPKILRCPGDAIHLPLDGNFSSQLAGHVSYFVGMDADQDHPQMFLSGDDNFAIGGLSVKSGLLEFSTNAPITWTSGRHDDSEKAHFWILTRRAFCGNIGLVDGSVASVTDSGLANLLNQTGIATNRFAIP